MASFVAFGVLLLALFGTALNFSVQKTCRIDPIPVKLGRLPSAEGFWTPEFNLESIEKVVVGPGPEDVAVDSSGNVYTGLADGWIKRIGIDGRVENFTTATEGLFMVSTDGVVSLLSNEVDDGTPVRFADGLVVAKDRTVYFSDVSFTYGFKDLKLDAMEGRSNGRLLKYDPYTKSTSVVVKELWFPNGVALSENEEYLLISETWRARILRYWLKGDNQGSLDTFIDNLPGCPDNIRFNRAEKSFYIGLANKRSRPSDWLMRSSWTWLRCLMVHPAIQRLQRPDNRGMLIVVSPKGELIKKYEDPTGKAISFITGGNKVGDFLYISGLGRNFLGRIKV